MDGWRGYRILVDGPAGADENMARDEALLAAFRRGETPPTWRIYAWTGPALTYGRMVTPPAPPAGVTAARRVSGGGVVPHGADLTYCVVRERRSGAANYEDIVAAVAAALKSIGIPAAVWRGAARGRRDYCFASLAPYDIHVGGRKIAGCAQRRLKDGILHHGSIANGAAPEVLRDAGLWDAGGTITIEEILGRRVGADELAAALRGVTGPELLRPAAVAAR